MSIFVKDKDGSRVKVAGAGLPGPAGKSAYQYAVEGGFSGTENEFRALMGVRSNPNLLDNWHFSDPINQRGQTTYTSIGYTIDRWMLLNPNTSLSLEDECVHFVNTSSESDDLIGIFSQRTTLKELGLAPGDVVTLSCLATAVSSYHGKIRVQFDNDTKEDRDHVGIFSHVLGTKTSYHFSTMIPDAWDETDALRFSIYNFGPADFKLHAVKLELGPVQTLAHQDADGNWMLNGPPPNKALELAKCQRYYHIYQTQSLRPKYAADCVPVMRANPAQTTINVNGTTYYVNDANL